MPAFELVSLACHPCPCRRRRLQAAPFLRGEWNTSKIGLLAPFEQRIGQAVDAMLGAVPVWFKVQRCWCLLLMVLVPPAGACCWYLLLLMVPMSALH
jgi:hypothetical protein